MPAFVAVPGSNVKRIRATLPQTPCTEAVPAVADAALAPLTVSDGQQTLFLQKASSSRAGLWIS